MAQAKLPPHSLEAEQAVLGGLMLDSRSWADIADKVSAEDFYREDHRMIFSAIAGLADNNRGVDSVSVTEALRTEGVLERVTAQYIGELAMNTPSAANIRAWADIVRERSIARSLIAVGTAMAESGFTEDGRSVYDKLDSAEAALSGVRDIRSTGGPVSAREAAKETIDHIERHFESGSSITGLSTGLPDLDVKLGGLQGGDLIYIAGRPAMGKTSVACGIAEHACLEGGRALVFSMEMSRMQIMQRAFSRHGNIPLQRLRNPQDLKDADWPKITEVTSRITNSGLLIDDQSGLTILDVRARARREHRRSPLSCIVVDYIQLMTGDRRAHNRNAELEPVSRGLKALAKELNIPVIALSQLNRECEKRDNKRPRMSDLRDAGSMEQDADVIIFVYRDEVYYDESPHEGIAELIIGKQRNGATGTVETTFQGEYVRFLPYGGPPKWEREPKKRRGNVRSMAEYRMGDE